MANGSLSIFPAIHLITSRTSHTVRVLDLAGANSWEQALCDQTLELINDLIQEVVKYFFEKDEDKKVCVTCA